MNRAFELLLAELEDDAGLTDAEVEAELKAAGVDLRSARTKLDATLLQVENAAHPLPGRRVPILVVGPVHPHPAVPGMGGEEAVGDGDAEAARRTGDHPKSPT